jgi:glycosyltransferase involved in cell wall biosynthesis
VTEKKKILYITLRSGFGGATMHVDQLVQNFKETYEIYCAAPVEEPYGKNWQEELGSERFLELPYRAFSIKHLLKLNSFLKKRDIKIIHAHGKGAGLYGRLIKILNPNAFLIYTLHGLHLGSYNSMTKYLYILLERLLGKFTDMFINVSHGEKQDCLNYKLFKGFKSIVIYNAIEDDTETYLPRKELRKKLNLPQDKFLIVSVSRFNPQKNIMAILEIVNALADEKELLFLIIGEGDQKAEVENAIIQKRLSNVELIGYRQNVNEYLHASDMFLSTSLWEGLPYSLIEAARTGLPIIASDVTGNNEVVIDKENGYLFQLDDIDSLVNLLKELKDSSQTLETFGQNSKSIFEKYFMLHVMINKLKEIYSLKT